MANDFTIVGSPTFSTGKFGGNALTPSSGNYLTRADASVFRSSTGLTIEFWIKTTSTANFLTVLGRAGNEWWGIHQGKLYASPGIGATSVVVNDGYWHHVAWTYNGSTTVGYLDGVQVASASSTFTSNFWPVSGAASTMFLGARSDNSAGTPVTGYFLGQIDDLRISKTVRYTGTFTPPGNTHTGDSNTLGLYRLQADGTDSSGDTSPPPASPIPTTPTSVQATASAGQVALTWSTSTDDVAVTGYRIYRRTQLVGTAAGTSFTETGLPGGVKYDYRVTAVDGAGNESDPSALTSATTPKALKAGAPSVIFDADMSSDIDDIGALATLHALADLGECDIIGMGVSSTNGGTAEAMDVVNTYYGRPDIPVAVRAGIGGRGGYPGTLSAEFPHDLVYTSAPTAATLYRQLLAAAPDASVTIVTAGYLTNLQALLESPADGISSLTGSQLVAQKVKIWVPMGGRYPSGNEFNFMSSGDSSAFAVVNNWPTAATFAGFEVGAPIYSGGESLFTGTPASNPVRRAWEVFHDPIARPSFDQTAVYQAVRAAEGLFGSVTVGRNNTNSNGSNFWTATPDPSGALEQAYLTEKARGPLQAAIDALVCATPAALAPTAPTQPTNLRTTAVSGSSVTLAWTSNSYSETGFQIERRDNGVWSQIGTVGAGVTTYTDSGLASTAGRAYRVRATNGVSSSPYATLQILSWSETNLTTPANLPIYIAHHNNLLYGRAVAESHIAVCNDIVHGTAVTVTADVGCVGESGSICIYLLYQDAGNWYRLNVTSSSSKFEKQVGGGTVTQVGSSGAGISIGNGTKMQTWTVALAGSSLSFTSPSVTLNATDTPAFSSGKVGLGGLGRGPVFQGVTIAEPATGPTVTHNTTATGSASAARSEQRAVTAAVTAAAAATASDTNVTATPFFPGAHPGTFPTAAVSATAAVSHSTSSTAAVTAARVDTRTATGAVSATGSVTATAASPAAVSSSTLAAGTTSGAVEYRAAATAATTAAVSTSVTSTPLIAVVAHTSLAAANVSAFVIAQPAVSTGVVSTTAAVAGRSDTAAVGGNFGSGPFGSTPFGGGYATTIAGAVATAAQVGTALVEAVVSAAATATAARGGPASVTATTTTAAAQVTAAASTPTPAVTALTVADILAAATKTDQRDATATTLAGAVASARTGRPGLLTVGHQQARLVATHR